MKIIERFGKRYLKKDCLFCRKELVISINDLNIEYYGSIIVRGKYTCPNCDLVNSIKPFYVYELQKI